MVPFRQHLRADKNTRAAAMYFRQCCSSAPLRLVVSRSIRDSGTPEKAGQAPAPVVLCPVQPASDGLSRRKGIAVAPGAGCRNGGSVDAAGPGVTCSNDRSADTRQSSHSRGTAVPARSLDGSGTR
jgi:hypothetical protein